MCPPIVTRVNFYIDIPYDQTPISSSPRRNIHTPAVWWGPRAAAAVPLYLHMRRSMRCWRNNTIMVANWGVCIHGSSRERGAPLIYARHTSTKIGLSRYTTSWSFLIRSHFTVSEKHRVHPTGWIVVIICAMMLVSKGTQNYNINKCTFKHLLEERELFSVVFGALVLLVLRLSENRIIDANAAPYLYIDPVHLWVDLIRSASVIHLMRVIAKYGGLYTFTILELKWRRKEGVCSRSTLFY